MLRMMATIMITLPSQVVPGTPCLARFSEDDTIYRFDKTLHLENTSPYKNPGRLC